MPNKTIYVAQDDLAVFDAAKAKAGRNLSSVIVAALNEYLGRRADSEQSKARGFSEVIVTLGSAGYEHEKRFMGKRLFSTYSGGRIAGSENGYKGYTIYGTQKNQYVVVSCDLVDPFVAVTGATGDLHTAIVVDDDPTVSNKAIDILFGYSDGDYSDLASSFKMTICPTLDEVSQALPWHIYERFTDRLEQIKNPVEYLDI